MFTRGVPVGGVLLGGVLGGVRCGLGVDAVAETAGGASGFRGWFLNAAELEATREKLAKLQQRAAKRGFSGRLELEAVPVSRQVKSPGGLPVRVHGFDVKITGDPPRYRGWRFVAAVDVVPDGVVVRYPPGSKDEVVNDQLKPGECDHCHTVRARRSTVLVANDETGQLLQVGRSCLKDFLGHSKTPVFLTTDEVDEQIRGGWSGVPAGWDTHNVLTYAAAMVQAYGWTPASGADFGRVPTKELVRLALRGGRGADQVRDKIAPYLAEADGHARIVRTELLDGLGGDSGYEANLKTVLRSDAIDSRHLGLAVSAVSAYQRMVADRERETARQEAARRVDHVGQVGQKVTMSGIVRTALLVDGYHYASPERVMLVVDCGTAVAKMTTAASWAYDIEVGDPLTVTGTIKAHTEWNGTKQTVLTRPKQQPDPTPNPPPAGPSPAWETVPSPALDGAAKQHRTPPATTPAVQGRLVP